MLKNNFFFNFHNFQEPAQKKRGPQSKFQCLAILVHTIRISKPCVKKTIFYIFLNFRDPAPKKQGPLIKIPAAVIFWYW